MPSKKSGLAQQFYLGGYDLSGDVGSLNNASSPRAMLLSTGIDKSAVERIPGLSDGIIDFNTWFNDASNQEHAALKGLPTADILVIWATGSSLNDEAAALVAKQVNYDWARGADKSFEGQVLCQANGTPLEWGNLLTAGKRTDTSNTAGTSIDNTSGTTNGLVAYLQVFSVTGTNVIVAIQESQNDGSPDAFADVLAFTSATGRTSERKTATGTVERYLRVNTTGTFSEAIFAVMFWRGSANDDVDLS